MAPVFDVQCDASVGKRRIGIKGHSTNLCVISIECSLEIMRALVRKMDALWHRRENQP